MIIFAPKEISRNMNIFTKIIARQLSLPQDGVENTLKLLDEGCTIPFISRYRKERTGGLNEVQIAQISDLNEKLKEMAKRKETILKTITELGKLTPELQKRIDECWNATELEDIYLPYRPKRRTRAQVAREQGLEPLAQMLLSYAAPNPQKAAMNFVNGDVKDLEMALQGAKDIIAEQLAEDEKCRNIVRQQFRRDAFIISKVVKAKKDTDEAQKFSDYFEWEEPLRRCSSHRLLAMRRGENEGILRVKIETDDDECISRLRRCLPPIPPQGGGACKRLLYEVLEDGYKRLLQPSIETEFANLSKEKADDEAINVFAQNLRQLLMDAPLGQKRVMGIDPGFRTGCKVVCLDAQGNLLHHEAETRDFIEDLASLKEGAPAVFVVSEDGASVYSASKTAREEFPDEDVTVRGAVSIGRRLMDPLAELVKIDPKSIGVGQYQHDVDQTKLKHTLDQTVESCVNQVGVNLNTASQHLLTYVSGLGPVLAQNIVDYRRENGAFTSRAQLKKVPRLGPVAYQQCAGFLRIPGAKNPLDNSAVHPESYEVVERMAKDQGCHVGDLISNPQLRQQVDIRRYVTDTIGIPTLTDIMQELEKPGRDPREQLEAFEFDPNVKEVDDLVEGMILPGVVTNITNFGAFVDIGVHQDGLVHVSQLANKFVKDPNDVIHLHQHVKVKVLQVDRRRNRISLTMKGI